MSHDGNSLFHMMEVQPELHIRNLLDVKVATVKQLRQVSREFHKIISAELKTCYVHLGERSTLVAANGVAQPTPEELVKLMAGAQLERLKVTVNVTSGGSECQGRNPLASRCTHVDLFL